jgi:biotin operon repressor
MQPQADNPTPKAAPWAMIAADDQEKLCRELGAGRLAVWYRLSLYAVKAQSPRFAVSRRMLAFDCGLTREAVRQHLSDLERAGFIGVERSQAESHGDVANQYTIMRGPYAPPFSPNLNDIADLNLSLYGFRKFAGTSAFSIDYLFLLPVKEGYRIILNKVPAADGSFGSILVDDAWNNMLYTSNGTKNLGTLDGLFSPIRLIPGADQRLYFLFNDLYAFQPTGFHYQVRVWTVPLFMTLG